MNDVRHYFMLLCIKKCIWCFPSLFKLYKLVKIILNRNDVVFCSLYYLGYQFLYCVLFLFAYTIWIYLHQGIIGCDDFIDMDEASIIMNLSEILHHFEEAELPVVYSNAENNNTIIPRILKQVFTHY